MQKINGQVVFSASDVVHFMECEHLSALDRLHLDAPMARAKDSEEAALVQNRGFEHERAYLQKAKERAVSYIDIATVGESRDARVEATIDAMKRGVDLIYQAAFFQAPMVGYADFLKKVDKPSKLGGYSYEIIDTKLSKKSRAKFIIQLAFYADLLEGVQGVPPELVYIVLGDGKEEHFQLSDYRYYYQSLKQRFVSFLAASEQQGVAHTAHNSTPFPCDKCDLCHWRERCNSWWDETDHLTQVANILKTHIHKLNAAGIQTVEQLAKLPETMRIPKISETVLQRLRHQASLQHRAKVTGERFVELLSPNADQPAEPGPRGFARLPEPSPHDLFFDMEGFPHVEDGLEYLFGLYYIDDANEGVFKPIWGHDRAEEKLAFEEWVDFVIRHLERHPEAHIYHYAAYEKTALRKLMRLHGTRENDIDHLLRTKKMIDLYQVVREAVRISERSYSIKYVEKFYLGARSAEVKSAGSSIVAYQNWRDSDPKDQKILDEIEKYNKEDVVSTYELLNWLCRLRPATLPWLEQASAPEEPSKASEARKAAAVATEQQVLQFHSQISQYIPVPPDATDTIEPHTPEERHAVILRDLLDFQRRANKPQWWALFDRQSKSFEERIEDLDCVAGATLAPEFPVTTEQRSFRYTYRYPPQEVKLKSGDKPVLVDSLDGLSDFTIDHEQQLVTFKLGKQRSLPPGTIDIGKGKPIDPKPLQQALLRYAADFIAVKKGSSSRYPAISALLRRDLPAITGITPGQALLPEQPTTADIVSAVSRLNHSAIFIQGPPGAGKTHTGSKVIVSLLRAGKRIGVSSNSHKAIVNLLQAVEKTATEEGFSFKGVKKSDPIDPGQWVNGHFIVDVKGLDEVIGANAQLIGGTAWLFADPALDQQLDYLFVDEAGQVALGMLVPMATSAKNIVLLGDQMQLAQPVEGVHPGDSGDSVLDYLLQGRSTIPLEQGIFLENTWRMHPAVCSFISAAIYNGRLKSHPDTGLRYLVLNHQADPALKAAGIHFEEVHHEGCSQDSEEEAVRVKQIYDSLLKQHFIDDKGVQQPMSPHNILVVSPY
ncbi:MAG: TM0106 family RecB-like putative nuclease, partial [Oxalobacteraceae bacterium]|nr:TM0106 family RecB-like putative nuclease [Oxalobacteraceae bacterium]